MTVRPISIVFFQYEGKIEKKWEKRGYMRKSAKLMTGILICALGITACSRDNGKKSSGAQTEGKTTDVLLSENSENIEISIYCQDGIALFNNAIREFKLLSDVDVNVERFEDTAEMELRITTETLSGKGPDVWLFSDRSNSLDIHKMMMNGSFYVLDEFLEEEKKYGGYQEEKYYSCMMDAGSLGGKQYILPLSFNMTQYYADSSLIDAYYPSLQDGYDMQELLQALREECDRTQNDPYSMGAMFTGQMNYPVYMIIEESQKSILNYEEKQVALDREMMEEMMGFWKLWSERNKSEEILGKYGKDLSVLTHYSFMSDGTSMLNAVRHNVSQYAISEIKPYLYMMPAWDQQDSYMAYITEFGGVNKNSGHPKEAYDFLRTVMDYQVVYNFNKFDSSLYYNLPVNKTILNSALQLVSMQKGMGKFDIQPLPKEYTEQIEDILDHIDTAVIRNPKAEAIIKEVTMPYFTGEQEFDVCYTTLENRLKLYMAE